MSMTIFDDELTLPGVITQIVPDYLSGYDTSAWGTTESVTVIGTAFNGPVGKPTAVYTPEQAKYIFGDSFDPKTKREASLVPAIYEAWEKGCRTIYAVRISGKDMYKDYELATESKLKLRLSGAFPCNDNKSCYMTYQAKQGSDFAFGDSEGIIRIYKPADRTVISEKIAGVVNSLDSILVTEINLDANGFSKSSRLCDVIDLINNSESNNVLTLSLVDENGIPRTNATKEVQEICIGSLFPGIYTICRDEPSVGVDVVTDIEIVRNEVTSLFPNCTNKLWKKLVLNTDPSKPYPISASLIKDLKGHLPLSLGVDENYDFLKKVGAIDAIAIKNNVDYEEVDLDGFELYKKLGSGFVRTATLKEVGSVEELENKKYKVIPAPDGDEHRVIGIDDGIYSVLQMHQSDYIVLAAATAETKISSKLPKKTEFLRAKANSVILKNSTFSSGVISALCKIDEKDINSMITNYKIEIEKLPEMLTQEAIMKALISDKFLRVPKLGDTPKYLQGLSKNQLALKGTKLQKFDGTKFVDVKDSSISCPNLICENESGELRVYQCAGEAGNYTNNFTLLEAPESLFAGLADQSDCFIVGLNEDQANVYQLTKETKEVKPIISLQDLSDGLLEQADPTITFIEKDLPALNEEATANKTIIKVFSKAVEYCSIEEFVEELNSIETLSNKFLFEITDIETSTQDFPQEAISGISLNRSETNVYDATLHIPYTTTDNFARHLAQHCLYTSLKTYPTHGIIGCERLTGISLNTIATRIDEICSMDLDMYAKKSNGNNMLDNKNAPHPIGRCLSVTFMQYPVTTGNGYNYISSGAAGYAGMISTLDPDRSSTNQSININELMFSLSNYQLTKLNNAGIVCCRESTNGIVIVDGVTQAPATSAYRRLSTTKIINAVGRILKGVIEPFIGLPQTLAYLNSMETAIKSALNKLVNVLINDYSYEVITDSNAAKLGIVKIDYVIVPAYEIREVRNTVTISSSNM